MFSVSRSASLYHRLHIPRVHMPKDRLPFDLSLYLVANRPSFQDKALFFKKIMESVRGGVSCVQLRDHTNNLDSTLETAYHLKKMLKNTPLFINTLNLFKVAREIDADGVYLEEQMSYSEARKSLGEKMIIGAPVKTMEEVLTAGKSTEVDYLSVKISPSKKTCPRNDILWNMHELQNIRAISPHRIVAIGGLNLQRAESVYQVLRIHDGIAMAGGLMEEEDPCATAQEIQTIRKKVTSRGGL